MGYFNKSKTAQQETYSVTSFQKNKIKKEYGLTEGEIDMMIELRMKRDGKSLKKFIERILY